MREQDEEATVPPPDFSFDFAKTFQAFFKNPDLELYLNTACCVIYTIKILKSREICENAPFR